jgi:hypothetical protein
VFEFFLLNPIFHLIEDKKNKNMYEHFQRTQVFHFFQLKQEKWQVMGFFVTLIKYLAS